MLRGALALLLVLPFLAPGASAAATFTFDLVATEDAQGNPVYEGAGAANPTLFATTGARVTIHLVNEGKLPHNVVVGAPVSQAMGCCVEPGHEDNLTFDLPAGFAGDLTYQCALHGAEGMRGILRVGEPHPTLRIVEPVNGTTVRGDVRARVVAENATIAGPDASTLRYALDGAPQPNLTGPEVGLGKLAKGNHLLLVELVAPNGTVVAGTEALFFVEPEPAASTPVATATPPDATPTATSPTPGAPLALLLAGCAAVAFALRRRR